MKQGGLAYYGGKNPCRRLGQWIARQLPWRFDTVYCEPFAGMAGVLFCRQRVKCEVLNDKNHRLVNWWNVVRDHPDEFGRLLEATHQFSQANFDLACTQLDHTDPIRRAVAYTLVIQQSVLHGDGPHKRSRTLHLQPDRENVPMTAADIQRIRDRTAQCQIECADAVELLAKTSSVTDCTIYCDPPYGSADTSPYSHDVDRDALTAALLAQSGSVAVSGYNDEWDHLGWRSEQYVTSASAWDSSAQRQVVADRIERLWMNYDGGEAGLFDALQS